MSPIGLECYLKLEYDRSLPRHLKAVKDDVSCKHYSDFLKRTGLVSSLSVAYETLHKF